MYLLYGVYCLIFEKEWKPTTESSLLLLFLQVVDKTDSLSRRQNKRKLRHTKKHRKTTIKIKQLLSFFQNFIHYFSFLRVAHHVLFCNPKKNTNQNKAEWKYTAVCTSRTYALTFALFFFRAAPASRASSIVNEYPQFDAYKHTYEKCLINRNLHLPPKVEKVAK